MSTLFARQEIFTRDRKVFAYELLCRAENGERANIDNSNAIAGTRATSFVITHLFSEVDIETILNNRLGFINFTHKHIIEQTPTLLPSDKIVIEILENTQIDETLILAVREIVNAGYTVALDDFEYTPEIEPLLKLAGIVKIDIQALSPAHVEQQLAYLKDFQGKILAEKVETSEEFQRAYDQGFDLFQGYFFARPHPVKGKKISENKASLLRLLSKIHSPNITLEQIEEIILQVPKLSYRILRLANSAALFTNQKIDSLLEAIKRMGLIQISSWVALLLNTSSNDVSLSLIEQSLIRAKMCDILAHENHLNSHQAFTIGMFSKLDALLNESMQSLLEKVPLSEDINAALLYHQGELGELLRVVSNYEKGRFDTIRDSAFSDQQLSNAYLQGIAYSQKVTQLLR